jgi:hypothetical protein
MIAVVHEFTVHIDSEKHLSVFPCSRLCHSYLKGEEECTSQFVGRRSNLTADDAVDATRRCLVQRDSRITYLQFLKENT